MEIFFGPLRYPPRVAACSRCQKALPAGAGFCDSCGASVQSSMGGSSRGSAGFVDEGRGIALCTGCGAFAPPSQTTCSVCSTPLGQPRRAVPRRSDGILFALLRTEFQCRACGVRSPLDPLDMDEPLRCSRCGTVQMLYDEAWQHIVAYAHGITDLAGVRSSANAQLRNNPAATLGLSYTHATWENSGLEISGGVHKTRSIQALVAPGAPLCGECGSPVEARREGAGISTRCVACGAEARYESPPTARRRLPGSVVGAIADELRRDRPTASLDATSAGMIIAVKCPSCGAGLEVLQGAHFVVCRFCQTHCRIPNRTLLALKKTGAEAAPTWWLVFDGPSEAAERLARGRAPFPFIDDDDDDDVPEVPKPTSPKSVLALVEKMPLATNPVHETATWVLQIALPLGVLALVALAFFGQRLLYWAQQLGALP